MMTQQNKPQQKLFCKEAIAANSLNKNSVKAIFERSESSDDRDVMVLTDKDLFC